MAFDPFLFQPRIGNAGDDRFNVPGGRKLDGTDDTGSPVMIRSGGPFTAPTFEEVEAASGYDQVRAAIAYLQDQYENVLYRYSTGTKVGAIADLPLSVQDAFYSSAAESAAVAAINAIRKGLYGLTTNGSFPMSTAIGRIFRASHLAELRREMSGLSQILLRANNESDLQMPVNQSVVMQAEDASYPIVAPVYSYVFDLLTGTVFPPPYTPPSILGENIDGSVYRLRRVILAFKIPDLGFTEDDVTDYVSSVNLKFSISSVQGTPGDVEVYLPATMYEAPFNSAQIQDEFYLLGSAPGSVGSHAISIPVANLVLWAGQLVTMIWRIGKENNGSEPINATGNGVDIPLVNRTHAGRPTIEINFA